MGLRQEVLSLRNLIACNKHICAAIAIVSADVVANGCGSFPFGWAQVSLVPFSSAAGDRTLCEMTSKLQ